MELPGPPEVVVNQVKRSAPQDRERQRHHNARTDGTVIEELPDPSRAIEHGGLVQVFGDARHAGHRAVTSPLTQVPEPDCGQRRLKSPSQDLVHDQGR